MALTAQAQKLALFTVQPMTPTIGAEIEGIDLSKPVSQSTIADLRSALLEWKVLFFRDQDITTDQHAAFARQFGPLEIHPFNPIPKNHPEVSAITHDRDHPGRENVWHSDVTWSVAPSLGSILRAVEVPPVGGDTLFADMYAAYDGLSDEVKAKIEGRMAVHDIGFYGKIIRKRGNPAEIADTERNYPPVEHPVAPVHPETGRKTLLLNPGFTRRIAGLEKEESDFLLAHLYAQARIPEYQCRFRWQKNSIAFWDNRATQHYAVSDYWPAVRRVERVSIAGSKPRAN